MTHKGFIPLHFTGHFASDGTPVYEQDVLEVEIRNDFGSVQMQKALIGWSQEKRQYVFSFPGAMHGVVETRIVKTLGSRFLNEEMFKTTV